MSKRTKYLINGLFREERTLFENEGTSISENNHRIMKPMSVIYLASIIFYAIAAALIHGAGAELVILTVFAGLQIAFIILVCLLPQSAVQKRGVVTFLCVLFGTLINALSITLGIVIYNDRTALLFAPLLILMSLIYTLPIYITGSLVTTFTTIFCVLSLSMKPAPVCYEDVVCALTAWCIAAISIVVTADLRVRANRTHNMLERLSSIDSLTEVYNKGTVEMMCERFFKETLEIYASALLIIDLDDFKAVNDTFGHKTGDILLKRFADEITLVFKKRKGGATIGRIGGDEFLVLITDTTRQETADKCELLQQAMPHIAEDFSKNDFSCSIGVAISPDSDDDYRELFEKADHALYEAKERGRNTYHIFSEKTKKSLDKKLYM